MGKFFNKVYKKYRKEEIIKSCIRLRKIKINYIMDNITSTCWNYGLYYEIIMKTSNVLIIRVKGKKNEKLIQYDKNRIVFMNNFNRFLNYMNTFNIKRGTYIYMGIFNMTVVKLKDKYYREIDLVDKYEFIKEQLGLNRRAEDIIKEHKLSFIKYLPE
ncbi:hypothetical protein CLOACE_11440 [Clostridium acetireducens DSM 10703]|uniref:Uncharacterized protein n=1 Tax=Clostridium acetireducens DSM 10703 TaxID=1121290 RepID=A0A1E8EZ44_9CLOT|nr:hypothetical protein [Clostridium acetireducens]OFI06245.1 hypothetical protein CLOACE_11440 [Clostridium acetireducens DSM 10703]